MANPLPLPTVSTVIDQQQRELRIFSKISGDAFQHPSDREASNAIQAIPLFSEFYKFFQGSSIDQQMRMMNLLSMIRIGPDQAPDLYARFVFAARILDIEELPELYLNCSPEVNAYAGGINRPMVVLQRGIISMLSEAELLSIIGHELAHIKCRHALNQSLANFFSSAGVDRVAGTFPIIGYVAMQAIEQAILYWARMAEFSCDRAAVLVVQDPNIAATAMAKTAGFQEKAGTELNFDALLRQLDDYERYDGNVMQAFNKLKWNMNIAASGKFNHPWTVLRVKRILDWGKSDHYSDILHGDYVKESSHVPASTPGATSLKCQACGNFMPTGSGFCSFCGNRL